MTAMFEVLPENVEIGYKVTLPPEDARVVGRLLYHGRLGGDLGAIQETPMFFYAEGHLSSVFSEHIFMNGDATYRMAEDAENEAAFVESYLSQAPTIFPVRVTMDNPVILDMAKLVTIAEEFGVSISLQEKFVADFEDSDFELRNQVFEWARQKGHDGVIIVNDMTPGYAGGDWCFRTSYVALNPQRQVQLGLGAPFG